MRCGQTPNGAAGVRTHIENNVFEFERHGATRRGAALRIRCASPFRNSIKRGRKKSIGLQMDPGPLCELQLTRCDFVSGIIRAAIMTAQCVIRFN